jgi:hypothetical protein
VTQTDTTTGPYFEITLDAPLAADFDYLASNPAATGSGYILRGNTIANHRARGMLLKADHGLVEGNTIDGSSHGRDRPHLPSSGGTSPATAAM